MASKLRDHSGQVFGRLTVIRTFRKDRTTYAECICSCGNTCNPPLPSLKVGGSTSCGCYRKELFRKHGYAQENGIRDRIPEYETWTGIKQRCYNQKCWAYKWYGGKGITVCDRWLNSFENFLSDVGRKPTPKHSLDRYPNKTGNYEPCNVRWATAKEQGRNKTSNRNVTINGETKTVAEWVEMYNLHRSGITRRLANGADAKEAILSAIANGPCFKKVIDKETGTIYNTIKEAAKVLGCHPDTLTRRFTGKRKNNTSFDFYNDEEKPKILCVGK